MPKPVQLKVLQGNAGKRALNLSDGINPKIEVPTAPAHLGKAARKEWKRITPILEQLGLISGLDVATLALYCQCFGRLSELETAFNRLVDKRVEAGEDYSDAVCAVSQSTTASGYVQTSVLSQNINSMRLQVHRYCAHFGLSPSLRGRVTASNYQQPTLPGVDEPPQAPAGFAQFSEVRR